MIRCVIIVPSRERQIRVSARAGYKAQIASVPVGYAE